MSTADSGDRTQRPTERRRREARARGDVARSADVVSSLVLLASSAGLWWLGPSLQTHLARLMASTLSTAPPSSLNTAQVAAQLTDVALQLSITALPLLLLIVFSAALSNLLQTGFLWVPIAVTPQLERVNPATGFGRLGTMNAWLGPLWGFLKLVVLCGTLIAYIQTNLATSGPLVQGTPLALFSRSAQLLGGLAVNLSLVLLALAIANYAYHFWRNERQLMMTIEEVRREQREDEVDPQLKQRRQAAAASGRQTGTISQIDGVRPV